MAGIFVATAASATIAAGSGATRAEATDGAAPAISCATTTACIEGDNTSTGPGVKGTSAKGNGTVGTTKSKGTSTGTSRAGVIGQDLQSGGGTLNFGVEGISMNGTGVEGTSTNGIGVSGTSILNNQGQGTGVFGRGEFDFFADSRTQGEFMFWGFNPNSSTRFSVDGLANTSIDGELTVAGAIHAGSGFTSTCGSCASGIGALVESNGTRPALQVYATS